MADATVRLSHHGTLVASTVDIITFTENYREVEVVNRDGSAAVYFTVDGTKAPAVGDADTYVLPAAIGSLVVRSAASGGTVVRLISAGTPAYSVTGVIE